MWILCQTAAPTTTIHQHHTETHESPHIILSPLYTLFLSSGSLIVLCRLWNVKVGGWSTDSNHQDSVLDVEVWFLMNLCLFQRFQQTPLLLWLLSYPQFPLQCVEVWTGEVLWTAPAHDKQNSRAAVWRQFSQSWRMPVLGPSLG